MRELEKYAKKWSFLIMWFVCGVVFLWFFDEQNVYGGLFGRQETDDFFEQSAGKNAPDEYDGKKGTDSGKTDEASGDGEKTGEGKTGEGITGQKETGREGADNGEKAPGSETGNQAKEASDQREEKEFRGFMTVGDDYFSDALFIGDSRTVGLSEYGGLDGYATFYASKGLTIYTLMDAKIVNVPGKREKITIPEALENADFKKIYLMVGINELGTGTAERFAKTYGGVLQRLHELQPEAVIYIEAILKVTQKRSDQGDYITNEGIEERNEAIRVLADDQTFFYLDANPAVCGEDGGMKEEYTTDGVHLKGKDIYIWKDFLKEHAVWLDGQKG